MANCPSFDIGVFAPGSETVVSKMGVLAQVIELSMVVLL